MNNFLMRTISSFFLFLIFFTLLFSEGFLFIFLIQIMLFITIWEFLRLLRFKSSVSNYQINNNFFLSRQRISYEDYCLIFLICFLNLCFFLSNFYFSFFFVILILIFYFFYKIFNFSVLNIFGLTYFSVPYFLIINLKIGETFYHFFIFIIIFSIITDVSAYVVGNRFKGIKLARTLSPNKTISGFLGAIIIPSSICTIIYSNSYEFNKIFFTCVFFSLIVQFGDLLESFVKRKCFVKESSNLIPGHGGIMDRLDGVFLLIIVVSILNILDFNFFFIV